MRIKGCEAFVTGAAGGIGARLVAALAERGARRIHAADLAAPLAKAAFPENAGVEPLALDVTDEAAVQRAAQQCTDVTLVINNAAIVAWEGVMSAPTLSTARTVFEINYWGYLHVARAFAPVLARNGGGGTQVLAVFPSSTDTPMVAGFDGEKQRPESVAEGICDALEEGVEDVCIGAHSIQTEALMRSDPKAAEREFAALLPGALAIPD